MHAKSTFTHHLTSHPPLTTLSDHKSIDHTRSSFIVSPTPLPPSEIQILQTIRIQKHISVRKNKTRPTKNLGGKPTVEEKHKKSKQLAHTNAHANDNPIWSRIFPLVGPH